MIRLTARLLAPFIVLACLTGCGCDRVFSATVYAFVDEDGNGQKNANEHSLPGVTFTVYDERSSSKFRLTKITDESGKAEFSFMYGCRDVAEWVIEATPPAGFRVTTPTRVRQGGPRHVAFVADEE
jgi:hypothetical protein